ncbi:hypothetical protein Tco_1284749 [Tanacetum coccineum]
MGMKEVGMVVSVVLRRWWWLVMVSAVVMAAMVMRWLLVAADEDVGGDCTMVVAAEEVVTRWLWGDYVVKVAAVRWEDVNEGDSGGWRPENGRRFAKIWPEKREAPKNI